MATRLANRVDDEANECTPLLRNKPEWRPQKGFWWMETALWANVFLSGFDGTITASTYALISSEFNAANSASWLTTSYLISSTAFQPLYGRFSDILGRRVVFFVATITFMIGCLGCAAANHILLLNAMRCLTGIGGGGLITMATIINSDVIPFEKRGMYQATQNVLVGFGAVSGASLGGFIADLIGWRWCFLLQVPVSLLAFTVGYYVLENPPEMSLALKEDTTFRKAWARADISGSLLLVVALLLQLLGLGLAGNVLAWSDPRIAMLLAGSVAVLVVFLVVEAFTRAAPVVPLRMLRGRLPIFVQITNIFVGMASYAYLFMLPLFFQVVLLDTPSQAGTRLVVPSISTPVGGFIAGYVMSRWGKLAWLVRCGTTLMLLGNLLVVFLGFVDDNWKYLVFLIPANLGLGMTNPSVLFSFVSAFEHQEQAVATSLVYLIRSLGTIYGVTITSAIVQNVLVLRLPDALKGIENSGKVIEEIRHSVYALHSLPAEVQVPARIVYYEAIRIAFLASTVFCACAVLASLFANAKGLRRSCDKTAGSDDANEHDEG